MYKKKNVTPQDKLCKTVNNFNHNDQEIYMHFRPKFPYTSFQTNRIAKYI